MSGSRSTVGISAAGGALLIIGLLMRNVLLMLVGSVIASVGLIFYLMDTESRIGRNSSDTPGHGSSRGGGGRRVKVIGIRELGSSRHSALRVLEEKYKRGEITRETYERLRRELENL